MSVWKNFIKGIIKENPVLVLLLGTCPTLAMTDSVSKAFGMGVAATVVLICSNMAISALRNVIPDKVRIPCYIVLIAGFVTVVEMVMHAYLPDLYEAMGVYHHFHHGHKACYKHYIAGYSDLVGNNVSQS